MAEDQQVTANTKHTKDLVVLAVQRYCPIEDDEPEYEEVEKTAPQLSAQLLIEKGKRYNVIGSVDWWLYVKCMDTDKCGYIPSTFVVPLRSDLSTEE
jgi:hypothetical protein